MATVIFEFLQSGNNAFVDTNEGNMAVVYSSGPIALTFSTDGSAVTYDESARQTAATNTWAALGASGTITGVRLIQAIPSNQNFVNVVGAQVQFICRSPGGDVYLGDFAVTSFATLIDNSAGAVVATNQPSSGDMRFEVFCEIQTDGGVDADELSIGQIQIEITYSDTVVTASETSIGSETKAVLASISQNESGIGTSAASILAQIPASDPISGTQSQAVNAMISANESGLGTESQSVSVGGSANESTIGSETRSVLASITAAETGIGSESQSAVVTVSASETGIGSETTSMAPFGLGASESGIGNDAGFVFMDASIVGFGESLPNHETIGILASISFLQPWGGSESLASGLSAGESGIGIERQYVYDLTNPPEIGDKTFAIIENPATFAVINQSRSFV